MSCARAALFSGTATMGRPEPSYWQPELETMSRSDLTELQLEKFRRVTLTQAFQTISYSASLHAAGFKSHADVKTMDDFHRLPFTTRNELRNAVPSGSLALPQRDLVGLHAFAGTSTIYHSQNDIANWTNLVARSIVATGCTNQDIFQSMMSHEQFSGGLGLHDGAKKAGLMVVAYSPGNSQHQLKLMQDFCSTVVDASSSYLLQLHSKMLEEDISRASIKLRKAFIGAEAHNEDRRRQLEQIWKIEVYNSYGPSEMNGPGVAFECSCRNGMHLWEDAFIMEIIDPKTLEVLADGTEGELVLTTLDRMATPLLRYRTGDLTQILNEPCPCGRTHRRIANPISR